MPGEKVEIACSGKITIFYVKFGKIFCKITCVPVLK